MTSLSSPPVTGLGAARLCYVDQTDQTAFFTTCDPAAQWGDDWDDCPYEHNAGTPYLYRTGDDRHGPYVVVSVRFDGPFVTPSHGWDNSPYSVAKINAGTVPWLRSSDALHIWAGATIAEFVRVIESGDGIVPRLGSVRADVRALRTAVESGTPAPALTAPVTDDFRWMLRFLHAPVRPWDTDRQAQQIALALRTASPAELATCTADDWAPLLTSPDAAVRAAAIAAAASISPAAPGRRRAGQR
jgi:hypothetical protein